MQHETRRTLENIKLILAGCDAEMADVVKCTVFLKDGRDFAAMNEIYAQFFGQSKPVPVRAARCTLAEARNKVEFFPFARFLS